MPYTINVQEGGGTEADTGGGKEDQDRGEAEEAEAEQRVKATDESTEQRVETRSVPEMKVTELKAVAMEESVDYRAGTRVNPEVELIELKAVATVESMEQKVETRVKCNATSAGSQLTLQVTRCQLKKWRLYKAPPPSSAQKRAISFGHRTKEITFLFLFSQGTQKLACSCMQKDIH